MSVPAQRTPVTAVVPVKALDAGKSRLRISTVQRRRLAAAFALDVLAAVRGCALVSDVLVVSADLHLERSLGVPVVPDPGRGLLAALEAGCAQVREDSSVLVVPADLPFLTAGALTVLLQRHARGFVPDREGTGTTLLVQQPGARVELRYGDGSAAAHEALGLPRLEDVPPGLRHDVDRLADLWPLPGEVLGPATKAALRLLAVPERRAG